MDIKAKLSCPIGMTCRLSNPETLTARLYMPAINSSSNAEIYQGDYKVVPKPDETIVLKTANKTLIEDVTVTEIPYYEVSNTLGKTVYIGKEIVLNGNQ